MYQQILQCYNAAGSAPPPSGGITLPDQTNILLYTEDVTGAIALSVDDYDKLTTAQQNFFFSDASTPNSWPDFSTFYSAISEERWFNKTNNVIESETNGIVIYDKQTAQSNLASARALLGLSVITEFVMLWRTTATGETITIPTLGGYTYNATVDWGDGTAPSNITADGVNNSHTYANAGYYTVSISGTFPAIYFNNGGDKSKLIEVLNLGEVAWTTMSRAFYGCSNLIHFRAGNTNTSQVTDMSYMMRDWSSMINPPDLSTLDTSQVTSMKFMMSSWSSMINPPDLSNFDTSQVTTMYNMMPGWSSMINPPDLSNFDTSQVTDMGYMLYGWSSMGEVDIRIDAWDISSVTSLTSFLEFSKLTTARYDAVLIAWNALTVNSKLSAHFGTSKYSSGGSAEAARNNLISSDSWTITDGGAA